MRHPKFFKPWFVATVLLAVAVVVHALYFDWSDAAIHGVVGTLCILAALRWQRTAAGIAASILVAVTVTSLLPLKPADWADIRSGDDWKQVQRHALWVIPDDEVVKATVIGGS